MNRACDHLGSTSNVRCDRCGAPLGAGGEASGLIDVRALAAMMSDTPRATPPVPRFGDLAAAPVAIAPLPAGPAPRVAAVAPSQQPLYFMVGILALGMMGLMMLIVSRPAAPPAVVASPAVVAAAPERAEEPEEPAAAEVVPAESEPVETAGEAPKAEPSGSPKSSRKTPRKQPANTPATPEVAPTKPAAPAKPAAPSEPAVDSVACLLGSEACKPKAKPAPAPAVEPQPVSSSSLPEKLEPADISEGTRASKAAAQDKCRSLARGGEKVTIKLSISGPEGTVLSASPQDDAGNQQLAACCAAELKRSSFKKVQKAQIGAVATLKF